MHARPVSPVRFLIKQKLKFQNKSFNYSTTQNDLLVLSVDYCSIFICWISFYHSFVILSSYWDSFRFVSCGTLFEISQIGDCFLVWDFNYSLLSVSFKRNNRKVESLFCSKHSETITEFRLHHCLVMIKQHSCTPSFISDRHNGSSIIYERMRPIAATKKWCIELWETLPHSVRVSPT